MNQAIKVLDHGLVRLVEHMGSDLSIVRNARVSYDAEWRAGEDDGKDAKLLNYLIKNKHTSPHHLNRVYSPLKLKHRSLCCVSGTDTALGLTTRSVLGTPNCPRNTTCPN